MGIFRTAKEVSEDALRLVGAFPPSRSQADASELRITLGRLETILNYTSGIRPLAGYWTMFDIPIEAGIGDYELADYASDAQIEHVFSVSLVTGSQDPDFIPLMYESEGALENLTSTGRTRRAVVTRDKSPILKIYPTPTSTEEDAGAVLRVRVQTYESSIDKTGTGNNDLKLRPAWYLWMENRLAYEIGKGPVRRLNDNILKRFKDDADAMEAALLARDGQHNTSAPPVTLPIAGA
jgi:hypothetical protein